MSVFVGDGAAEGADLSGAITVTLDEAHRVVGVRLVESESVRVPDALARTFAEAYSAALAALTESVRGDRTTHQPGQRPTPRTVRLTVQRPTKEQLTRHSIRNESRHLSGPRRGEIVGISDNECVHVILAPAQPVGALVADAGWLANASLDKVGKAINEAFQNAYSEKGTT